MEELPTLRLDGKVALITGSTRGIGQELATGFARAGARVWVHGRSRNEAEQLAAELGGPFVVADLSTPNGARAVAETVITAESQLDILVNNAGVEETMPIAAMDIERFDRVWHVNVRAPVELVHRLLPLLRAAPGASVINVTSIHDVVPYAQNSAYCASKAALAMFTRTIAIELGPEGIRVNNLAPGAVETDINREVLDLIGRRQFQEWIPLGRVAQTSEMVGPALFLASDASSYVTGATLYADGGYMQHLVRYRSEP
jgi:NAD(P)-dependent dehydrogenase (short-subunit alcohol dehydrogenase family)